MEFNSKIQRENDNIILTLEGRLDTNSASQLDENIQPIIKNPGKSLTIVIDNLTYISSSGLRCFVQLYNAMKAAGAEFHITGMQPAIREVFDLTGFTKVFGL